LILAWLRLPKGESYALELPSEDATLRDTRKAIDAALPFSALGRHYTLFFEDQKLDDPSRSLWDYGVFASGATLRCLTHRILLGIRVSSGKVHHFDVPSLTTTIAETKAVIEARVPAAALGESYELFFGGTPCEDSRRLEGYGIEFGQVLSVSAEGATTIGGNAFRQGAHVNAYCTPTDPTLSVPSIPSLRLLQGQAHITAKAT
jgi:hypothetical protein